MSNGTIDLTTGELRPHDPADRITQLAPVEYDPDAECPKWLETLELVFDGAHDLIGYVQKLLGYSISGDTGEHILPLCYGSGNNGKSTIWNPVLELLGDYAALGNESLLLGDKHSHPTEIAFLYQKRFLPISEPEHGVRLRESRVKELTGDRTITARRMKEDFWSFTRTHTFWISTNHLPPIRGRDEGIWRRVKLIPFTVDLSNKVKPIKGFDRWLVQNEGPGILAWLVRGFMAYQREGLIEPEAVTERTQKFRDDSDPLGDFLAEYCEIDDGMVATASELFEAYSSPEKFGGKWTKAAFGRAMAERFKKDRPTSGEYRSKTIYHGIAVKWVEESENEKSPDENPEKRPGNGACAQLQPVSPLTGNSSSRGGGPNGKTMRNRAHCAECPRCGSLMTPAEPVGNYQNWDCTICEHVEPRPVEQPFATAGS